MSIFSDVQRNIFNINIESYSKNIPSIHVDPMEYTFERKWKNNNIFKTPVHDLVYCPTILENMRSGLDFMSQIYQIIYNDKNESYYILSENGVYKTKDFISIKRININQDTFPAPSKRESAAYYDGKIYLICRKKVISIDKNDNIKIIANQDESYASYLSHLKIDENGLMYFIDNKDKLFLKQWDSFILKSSFIGTLESFKIYKNYIVVSTSAGVYLSKDSGTTFNLVVNRHHQVNDVFVPYIDQNGLFVFSNAEKKLITLKFNDSYSEKIIDLGYCRDFYSKNNTIYALCNEGLFKSTDWTYWVEEKEIIPNDWQRQIGRGSNAELRNNYNASGMFIDDKFEIYFGYGYSSQFGLRVKFKT